MYGYLVCCNYEEGARGLDVWEMVMKIPVYTQGPSGSVLRCACWNGKFEGGTNVRVVRWGGVKKVLPVAFSYPSIQSHRKK
jgi:hypothetical protein